MLLPSEISMPFRCQGHSTFANLNWAGGSASADDPTTTSDFHKKLFGLLLYFHESSWKWSFMCNNCFNLKRGSHIICMFSWKWSSMCDNGFYLFKEAVSFVCCLFCVWLYCFPSIDTRRLRSFWVMPLWIELSIRLRHNTLLVRCLFEFRVHTWTVFGVIQVLIFFCLNLNKIILDRVRISLPLWYQGLRRTIFACTILDYSLDFDKNTHMDEAFRWSEITQSVNLPKRSGQFHESQAWPCETLIIFWYTLISALGLVLDFG